MDQGLCLFWAEIHYFAELFVRSYPIVELPVPVIPLRRRSGREELTSEGVRFEGNTGRVRLD
jgi:hypothetical protein